MWNSHLWEDKLFDTENLGYATLQFNHTVYYIDHINLIGSGNFDNIFRILDKVFPTGHTTLKLSSSEPKFS